VGRSEALTVAIPANHAGTGMNERIANALQTSGTVQSEKLPYCIELWDNRVQTPERVLGRALNAPLAHAIFKAAKKEYPDRRIVLRRGARTIADSEE
jgi:hypothetical protein